MQREKVTLMTCKEMLPVEPVLMSVRQAKARDAKALGGALGGAAGGAVDEPVVEPVVGPVEKTYVKQEENGEEEVELRAWYEGSDKPGTTVYVKGPLPSRCGA